MTAGGNAAVEDQATDRAHRIGRTAPSKAHRLIAEGTLGPLRCPLEKKRDLADAVSAPASRGSTELSNEELSDAERRA
jgi:SNF2 family DNA or RNA helicase